MAERKNLASSLSKDKAGPEVLTEFDFADDIALLSEDVQQAQKLLCRVETSVAKIGLKMKSGKTKYMSLNLNQGVPLKTNDGTALKEVGDFKYPRNWMASTAKDIKMRKGPFGEHAVNLLRSGNPPYQSN